MNKSNFCIIKNIFSYYSFLKNWPKPAIFVYFHSFHMTNTKNDKSVDDVLGTRTRGGMAGW